MFNLTKEEQQIPNKVKSLLEQKQNPIKIEDLRDSLDHDLNQPKQKKIKTNTLNKYFLPAQLQECNIPVIENQKEQNILLPELDAIENQSISNNTRQDQDINSKSDQQTENNSFQEVKEDYKNSQDMQTEEINQINHHNLNLNRQTQNIDIYINLIRNIQIKQISFQIDKVTIKDNINSLYKGVVQSLINSIRFLIDKKLVTKIGSQLNSQYEQTILIHHYSKTYPVDMIFNNIKNWADNSWKTKEGKDPKQKDLIVQLYDIINIFEDVDSINSKKQKQKREQTD